MGYSRFWVQSTDIKEKDWELISGDVGKIFKTTSVALCASDDDAGPPSVDKETISFNSRGDDACETFSLNRKTTAFNCVKTNGEDYDVIVSATLLIACYRAPYSISSISNDDLFFEEFEIDDDEDEEEPSDEEHERMHAYFLENYERVCWEKYWGPALEVCKVAGVSIPEQHLESIRKAIFKVHT